MPAFNDKQTLFRTNLNTGIKPPLRSTQNTRPRPCQAFCGVMMVKLSAADWALKQVEAVREDPAKRLELLERTYHGPTGQAPHHLPFRRAAMAFMRWELARDVLAPLHAKPAGSPWWRAVNERLLRDGCEAVARSGGRGGAPSSA